MLLVLLVLCPLTQVLQEAGSDDDMEYGESLIAVVKEEVGEGEEEVVVGEDVVKGEEVVLGEDEGGQVGPDGHTDLSRPVDLWTGDLLHAGLLRGTVLVRAGALPPKKFFALGDPCLLVGDGSVSAKHRYVMVVYTTNRGGRDLTIGWGCPCGYVADSVRHDQSGERSIPLKEYFKVRLFCSRFRSYVVFPSTPWVEAPPKHSTPGSGAMAAVPWLMAKRVRFGLRCPIWKASPSCPWWQPASGRRGCTGRRPPSSSGRLG